MREYHHLLYKAQMNYVLLKHTIVSTRDEARLTLNRDVVDSRMYSPFN